MKRKVKFFNLYGRVGKGFDWQLLRSNVKSNELAPLIIHYRRTYREVEHREQ
ncbi:hypothetical protein heid_93 [Escherichia phage heid]|uniref:Uncharacterized protein n=8 Tax=Felixounavirus TaxID=1198140 RepID=A0A6B9XAS3_9CAUD|nr:hypothetical protein [Shigella sonnei]EJR6128074.1 hypothetical protein [Escherichia coli]QEG06750.1 hypothetical protein JK55_00088 [Shigella phage JK55]QHR65080.1 hypothetical protein garuso_15 [Escherichia phage garuso]QHR66666.1 hypothetical protein heid_93 [Escherichia phage heid]QHR74206.1 hypothetical protein bumzen_46 [Escherichia phage bumzen]QHR74344.1 hypothetical protein dune_63 [Escherichia phage dune]QHR74411.1 hypothetical protein warpig_5 [Escherichia phage warpig]QHR7526